MLWRGKSVVTTIILAKLSSQNSNMLCYVGQRQDEKFLPFWLDVWIIIIGPIIIKCASNVKETVIVEWRCQHWQLKHQISQQEWISNQLSHSIIVSQYRSSSQIHSQWSLKSHHTAQTQQTKIKDSFYQNSQSSLSPHYTTTFQCPNSSQSQCAC